MKKEPIEKYLDLFCNLTFSSIKNFDDIIDDDIEFSDPFNNIKGKENFKNVAQVWKITNFDRQAALFNGASMRAITYGFSELRQLVSAVRTVR